MEKINTKEFIKDYIGAVKSQKDIESIIPEIKLALASNKNFLDSEITSTKEIKKILDQEFENIKENATTLSETKDTVSKMSDTVSKVNNVLSKSSDGISKTKEVMSELNDNIDVVGKATQDLSGTSKNMISNMKNISLTNTKDNVGTIKDAFVSSYTDVMGEQKYIVDSALVGVKLIGGLFSDLKNRNNGVGSDVMGGVGDIISENNDIGEKSLRTQEKTYDIQKDIKKSLNRMNDQQKSYHLEEQRGHKSKKFIGTFKKLGITMVLGALIGGIARVYWKPFELMLKGIKSIGISLGFIGDGKNAKSSIKDALKELKGIFYSIYKYIFNFKKTILKTLKLKVLNIFGSISLRISNWLQQFEKIEPFVKKAEGGMKWLIDGIKSVYGFLKEGKYLKYIFALLGSSVAHLGVFIKSITYGFEKLFLPLQVIFSTIDFIKGFMGSNEKTFMGKIKDGITQVIMSFIEFPIRVFAWIINKLSGGKFDNLAGNMIEGMKNGISKSVNFMLLPIRRIIDMFNVVGDLLNGDFLGAFNTFKHMIFDTYNSFMGLFDFLTPIKNFIVDKVGNFLEKDGIKDIFDPIFSVFVKISDFVGHITDYITDKIKKIPVIGKWFGKKETPKAKQMKIQRQIVILQQDIQKQEKELKSGDTRDWKLRKRTSIIADKKKKIAKLQKQKKDIQEKESKDFTKNYIENKKLQMDSEVLNRSIDKHPELQQALKSIKKHEGYKKGVYRDSEGYWTGGYGTLLSKNRLLSKKDALKLAQKKGYKNDWDDAAKKKFWSNELTKGVLRSSKSVDEIALKRGVKISPKQKAILTDMTYNLGEGGINKFDKMWGALKSGDSSKAANEMKNSKWYGQVKSRGVDLVSQMRKTKGSGILKTSKKFIASKGKSLGINKKREQIKKPSYGPKVALNIGKGDISDMIPLSNGTYLTYNYSKNQKYRWNDDDLRKMGEDYLAGKSVSFGTSFIPKDASHEMKSTPQSTPKIALAAQMAQTAKMSVKKKEMQTQNELNNTINKSIKDNKTIAQNDKPVIIQNNNNDKGTVEPPEDIEAMSILWLNKSYGLG